VTSSFEVQNVLVDIRFEVFTAVTMKNAVFWDVRPRGSSKNRCFGGTQRESVTNYCLHFPSSTFLVTLKMEALRSSETSVLAKTKRCNIPEDGILLLVDTLF
jgi:hypothetical protein